MRRIHWRWIAFALVIAVASGAMLLRSQASDPLTEIAPMPHRPWQGRLTAFGYAKRIVPRSGEISRNYRQLAAAAELQAVAGRERTAENLHRLGLGQMAVLDVRAAVAMLREAARLQPRNALVRSDLAGAYLELAASDDARLVDALAAGEEAVRLDPTLAPAFFNRALAREQLASAGAARDAWRDYLALDSTSGWAVEAGQHLAALTAPAPDFARQLAQQYSVLASGDSRAAENLVKGFAQDARAWGEGEILARWADSFSSRAPGAAEHLAVARALGTALVAVTGERLLLESVHAIDAASESERRDLAAAHLLYRTARIRYSTGNPGIAEPMFHRVAMLFESGRSPMASVAVYFAANTAFDQNRIEQAMSALTGLETRIAPGHRALHAQRLWELGLCRNALGRSAAAATALNQSAEMFKAGGERENEAFVRSILADIHAALGDFDVSWRERVRAMRILRAKTNSRLLGAFLGASVAAMQEGDLAKARALTSIEVEIARGLDQPHPLVLALLRQSLIDFKAQRPADARVRIADAERATATITDPSLRARSEADLRFARAVVILGDSPRDAEREITVAIDFHRHEGRIFQLPDLYLARGRAWKKAGDAESALADFHAGIEQIESLRGQAPPGTPRWGIFDAARDLYADAIALHLERRELVEAWEVADQTRARGLLDDIGSGPAKPDFARLERDTTLIEFAFLPDRLVTFIVDSEGVDAHTQTLTDSTLGTSVARLREAIARGDEAAVRLHAASLHDLLLAPVNVHARRLVVVPTGSLYGLPFGVLLDRWSNRFLIEQCEVVVAPSASAYLTPARTAPRRDADRRDRVLMVSAPARSDRAALPGAEREARLIAGFYRDAEILSSTDATKERFLAQAENASVIHVSGHGTAEESAPGALLMAGDGSLSEREIGSRRLPNVRLVVLATCDSARGTVHPAEGPLSTARGFLSAGVPSVVASLWPLDDDEAAGFFAELHRRLAAGETAPAALRETQIAAISRGEWKRMNTWAAAQAMGR